MVVGGDLTVDLMVTTSSYNPSTSNLTGTINDDDDTVWMLEILGLDQTNVFLRTGQTNRLTTAYSFRMGCKYIFRNI